MRKPPYRHPVTGHYRDGKYVSRYTRGEGDRPRREPRSRKGKPEGEAGFRTVLYYPEGRETYKVRAGNYTEAVASGVGQAERGGLPKRVRVRRLKL